MEGTIPLRVAFLPNHEMFKVKLSDEGKYTVTDGYERTLMLSALEFLKLPYVLVAPKDLEWGKKLPDGNWTGLMGMLARNEAELAFGRVMLTQDRATDFDYSYPYDLDVAAFASAEPGIIYSPLTFIYPFELQLWIAVAITVMCLTAIVKIVSSKKFSLLASFFNMFGGFLRQPISVNTSTLSDKFLVTAVLFGILFISTSYSAVLLSFMTVPFYEKGVRDVKTLSREVDKGNMKLFSPEKFLIPHLLSNHPDSRVRTLMAKLQKNNWYLKKDRYVLRKYVIQEKNALLAFTSTYRLLLGMKNYIVSTDKFTILPQVILMKRNSTLRDRLNKFAHIFFATGLYEKDVDFHFFKKDNRSEDFNHELNPVITLQQTKGVFFVLVICHVLAIFIFLFEILFFRLTRKKNTNRKAWY